MLAVFVLGAALHSNAQKLKQHGDLNFLKGQDQVNVVFDYDGVMVGKMTEEAYLAEKVAEVEAKEGPGAGERWLEKWNTDRKDIYEPNFFELLNKGSKGVHFGSYPNAKYTLELKVTRLEPGFNIGVMRKPAEIDAIAYFQETGSEPLAHVTIDKAPGRTASGYDFDVASRVREAFAISGKRLASLLKKKAFK